MQTDVSKWSKVTRHMVPELREIPVPSRRFTEENLDIVGPLPPSQGFHYLLTMIDRNTRWIEVPELNNISAANVVFGFIRTWILRYGVPVTVVTDPGCQFKGEFWSTICKKLHTSHRTTTSYHPESNRMIERVHRNLKASLRAKCTSSTWTSELPLVLLGLWSAPRESDSISSFERTFGVPPILPGDFSSSAETPNNEFLEEFQRAIGTYTPPSSSPKPVSFTYCSR